MENKLTIIISTLNNGIFRCENAVKIIDERIYYLIVHQNHENVQIPDFLNRKDISVITTKTKGLSISRNIGLRNCITNYALIADDDVEYIKEGINFILNLINKSNIDIGLFKIKTYIGQPQYKDYPLESYDLKLDKKHWVSSVELLININSLRNNQILFDENFGLGTKLKKGEEEILIYDSLKKNLKVSYFPIYLLIHPFESSGKVNVSNNFKYFFKGAFDIRVGRKTHFKFSNFRSIDYVKNYFYYNYGKIYMKLRL